MPSALERKAKLRPSLSHLEAECLMHAAEHLLDTEDPIDWLGTIDRVAAARRGIEKLRWAVYGPPQSTEEEMIDAHRP